MATKTIRKSLTTAQIREGVGAELLSLLDGITDDGKLTEAELRELREWLQENGEADLPAVNVLETEVYRILADGVVTQEELDTLHKVVESVLPIELRKESKEKRKLLAAEAKSMAREARERSRRIDSYNFMVAGAHLDDRQRLIEANVAQGNPIWLFREPTNRYDRNAICVVTQAGHLIGYVPRDDAVDLAPLLDAEGKYTAYVTKILGYQKIIPVVQADIYGPMAEDSKVGRPLYACPVAHAGSGRPGQPPGTRRVPSWLVIGIAVLAVLILLNMCSN